ncbi:MAG: thioredoxin family protein [Dehalococcoidia bacterium]
MTMQRESVVTPERFDQGMTWAEWMAHIKRNVAKFQYNYDNTAVSAEDAEALRAVSERPGGPGRVLVLGEDWCPDVFRGLPVLVRMAEAAGWEIKAFPRDENLDIMAEFLKNGEHQSIPAVVFYTRDHKYITHWIERPAKAETELDQMRKIFDGLDREKDVQEMRRRNDEFQEGPVWAGWRDATITEIRALLEGKSK